MGGGGGQLRWQSKPSPLPQDADSPPKQADLGKFAISPRDGWSLKSPRDYMWRSRAGVGDKVAIFLPTPLQVVLARNLFSKLEAGASHLPDCSVKVCLPLSSSCENGYSAYIVSHYISWGEGGIQSQLASLHSTDNISAEDSDQARTKPATKAHVGQ